MNLRLRTLSGMLPPALAVLLAACGGGGGEAGDAASPAGASTAAPATPPSTPTAAPVATPPNAGSTCGIADFASLALARINQLRAAGASCRTGGNFAPAAALAWNAQLSQAAEVHTQDMVAKNFFSHTGASGSSLSDRVNATGYAWSDLGENIAAGYAGIDKVMEGWMASDGHCANLMNPTFTQVGLVCVPGSAGTSYPNYWTMDLARAR